MKRYKLDRLDEAFLFERSIGIETYDTGSSADEGAPLHACTVLTGLPHPTSGTE